MFRIVAIISLLASITIASDLSSLNPLHTGFSGNNCTFSKDFTRIYGIQPLILQRVWIRQDFRPAFLYPNDKGIITIPEGNVIYFICPKDNRFLHSYPISEIEAVCMRHTFFFVGERMKTIDEIAILLERGALAHCLTYTTHLIETHYTNKLPCPKRLEPLTIGFNSSLGFTSNIELCIDSVRHETPVTYFEMSRMIGVSEKPVLRSQISKNDKYWNEIYLEYAYYFDVQLDVISEILNSSKLAQKRLKISEQYLRRGYLVDPEDFVYQHQKTSAFWYENTAPQWRSFDEGNWNNLKISVRQFASSRQLDLDVYTGVHGNMSMEDVHGNQKYIYLDSFGERIPVPKFFWRVIYDPLSRRGAAFVGLNDPFIKNITKSDYLCKDISEEIKWLNWNPRNITAGVSYACNIDDLRKAVKWLPQFNVIGVLNN